ncbi:ankyrin repeat-containing protein [Fusarium mundagurra]|uniref:Ankyrin repeat-containing protein n=1 Tax=Fusarium mundagurra TaxID=1567541 RepID=A0A8H5XQV5_9HYPO|nr:ankyrin repeat-containing protein [Fusarium mundagurra]
MSGIEVVGLLTATITIVETINKVYNGLKDVDGLPAAFQEVIGRLPLVQTVLQAVEEQIQPDANDTATQAMKAVVTRCKVRAEDLEKIFKAVASSEGMSRLERYRRVVRQLGKEKKVEALAKELLEDVHLLAERHAFQAATQAQVSQLREAIEELSQVGSSLPDEDGFTLVHSGSGDNVAGNKYTGNNQYHGSGQAFFAPIQNYYQVHVMAEVKQTPLHECLKSLYFPGMNDRTNDIDNEAEGTCRWLLQHPVYMDWVSCTTDMICIKGKPGSGKSTLLRFALYNGKAALELRDAAVFLSFFFHRRGVELQRTPAGLFRSLLYQLLKQAPDILKDIVAIFEQRCEERGKHGEKWRWHPGELRRLFISSVPKVLETRKIILFVDALDECDRHSARELAVDLKNLSQSFPDLKPFQTCFTCRHYPQILTLDNEWTIILDAENENDIKIFVQSYLYQEPMGPAIGSLISQRARGVFMWARLVLRKVQPLLQEGISPAEIKGEIEQMPKDFNGFYGEIIRATRYPSATRELMECICFSMRPLTTDELRWAMAVDPDRRPVTSLDACRSSADFISSDNVEMRIKSLSCGLTEVITLGKSRIVQFIHPSIKEFVLAGGLTALDNTTKRATDLVAAPAHWRLSRICICYLQMVLFSHPEVLSERDKSKFPLLHYAVTSWTVHAVLGEDHETFPSDLVELLGQPPWSFIDSWVGIYQRMEPLARDCPSTGSTLLHIASKYGLTSLLKSLLLNTDEVTINARDQDRQTPLWLAAKYGRTEAVKLLLHTGKANIMARDEFGRTSLSRAAEEGHVDVAQLLCRENEAMVNAGDNYNRTALSLATENGHTAVTELLLDKNEIDVDARDVVHGQTPLSWAARNGHAAVVELLLDTSNANVNARDKAGRTSLLQAAGEGHAAVVRVILKTESISVDARDTVYHQTPLLCAAQNGHMQVIKLLLGTNKVDVDAKDDTGRTSLSRAAKEGHLSVVKLLFDTGKANVNERDNDGQTPLDWAVSNNHEAMVELLSSANAVGCKTMMKEDREDTTSDHDLAPNDGSPQLVVSHRVVEPLQVTTGAEETDSVGPAILPTVKVKELLSARPLVELEQKASRFNFQTDHVGPLEFHSNGTTPVEVKSSNASLVDRGKVEALNYPPVVDNSPIRVPQGNGEHQKNKRLMTCEKRIAVHVKTKKKPYDKS